MTKLLQWKDAAGKKVRLNTGAEIDVEDVSCGVVILNGYPYDLAELETLNLEIVRIIELALPEGIYAQAYVGSPSSHNVYKKEAGKWSVLQDSKWIDLIDTDDSKRHLTQIH